MREIGWRVLVGAGLVLAMMSGVAMAVPQPDPGVQTSSGHQSNQPQPDPGIQCHTPQPDPGVQSHTPQPEPCLQRHEPPDPCIRFHNARAHARCVAHLHRS